ncbi:hypothetical protein [Rickettsiales endosymbiont of Stachyamoeba lipophora]|uniref:hypothetical protein n=1 Tax=Rickettsiales endosymbiont of Stachyamoeba lipophora TaxID=2486578 RepID=UPI000F64EE06|nr:hypothetical protein [Rickettsiales endosymbiont of Stachyamoeba lipophora]AZL16383.1 hypothetical protein EF513_07580 [Rickettsiales endosymbiont of Stachyamoeba lipophora]
MNKPITLYLIALAGSGKYTIASEIAKYGYKMVDNHLINNPIFSLLDLDKISSIPEFAWEKIRIIRYAVIDFVTQNQAHNFIFTNELLETEYDHQIYNQIKQMAEQRKSIFIPVKLKLNKEEHLKRIITPSRKECFKSINPTLVKRKVEMINISHLNLLELDITDLSAKDAAKTILDFVNIRR